MNRSYKLSLNNSHPNLYSITLNDGKSSISIEQIREMIKFANKSSFNNQYKIILINKSEFLNKSSSNAILKILEEPSKNTIFLILQSFVKHNLQGIVYLCGLILAQMLGYLVRPLFGNMGVRPDIVLLESGQKFIRKGRACNIIEDPWFSMYSCPSFHAIFHTFTIFFIHGYEFFILGGVKNLGLFLTLISKILKF